MKSIFSILLFVLPVFTLAQGGYSVQHFTNKQGLPANGVKGLEWESSTQLLWVGTEGGIVCWDGQKLQPAGLNEGRVFQMGKTTEGGGGIYTLCDNGLIYLIRDGEIKRLRKTESPLLTRSFALTREGGVLSEIDRNSDQILPSAIVPLGKDSWLAIVYKSVYSKSKSGPRLLIPQLTEGQIFKTARGIFIAGREGFWRWSDQRLLPVPVSGLPHGGIRWFVANPDGDLPMVFQDGKLYSLQERGQLLLGTLLFDGLPSTARPFLARQPKNKGVIVLADRIDGLYFLRKQSVHQLNKQPESIESGKLVTYGQAVLSAQEVASHSGLIYERGKAVQHRSLPVSGSPHLVRFGNELFFAHSDSLFRYNLNTGRVDSSIRLDGSNWTVFAETGGTLYVVTGYRVYRYSAGSLYEALRFPGMGGAKSHFLQNTAATEYKPGILALGSENQLRFVDLDRRTLSSVPVSESAPIRFILRWKETLLLCTYGEGMFVYERGKVFRLPQDKQGFLRFTHAVALDDNGRCYISTNNGLFIAEWRALLDAARTGSPVYYHHLGEHDGLTQTELNGGCQPAYVVLPDGTLSFPTMNGVAQLHPDSLQLPAPAGIILVRTQVNGQVVAQLPEHLPSGNNTLRFSVTFPFWGTPENLYAWYRLRHPDERTNDTTWNLFDPAQLNNFSFASLKPGSYSFEVRTFSGFKAGAFSTRQVSFRIDHPWYLQPAFLFLWAIAVAGLIWMTIRWRTNRLQRKSQELEDVIRQRTHEVGQKNKQLEEQLELLSEANSLKERLISVIGHNIITPLRYIHQATSMMRENARIMDPDLREKAVDSINDTSLELELLSVNLLNWIKLQHQQIQVAPEAFTLSVVAQHVLALLEPIAGSRGQTIDAEMMYSDIVFQYKDALQVIIYNLVLNASLHSGGTRIELLCTREDDWLLLEVRDNGKGIPEGLQRKLTESLSRPILPKETDNRGKGFGYMIIRDLLRLIQGEISIRSEPGSTAISVKFPNLEELSKV
ncbi:ATP-binding protein [Flaviaesturariibacter amylovorans]|uniref:Histidine kinase domain-containing protein n=1 Tax=Flaviaesturariibacter amylovorans TaxID=1084520 RepID=A0ABP8H4Z4_9BACT